MEQSPNRVHRVCSIALPTFIRPKEQTRQGAANQTELRHSTMWCHTWKKNSFPGILWSLSICWRLKDGTEKSTVERFATTCVQVKCPVSCLKVFIFLLRAKGKMPFDLVGISDVVPQVTTEEIGTLSYWQCPVWLLWSDTKRSCLTHFRSVCSVNHINQNDWWLIFHYLPEMAEKKVCVCIYVCVYIYFISAIIRFFFVPMEEFFSPSTFLFFPSSLNLTSLFTRQFTKTYVIQRSMLVLIHTSYYSLFFCNVANVCWPLAVGINYI